MTRPHTESFRVTEAWLRQVKPGSALLGTVSVNDEQIAELRSIQDAPGVYLTLPNSLAGSKVIALVLSSLARDGSSVLITDATTKQSHRVTSDRTRAAQDYILTLHRCAWNLQR